jgi:transcriptional regulator with XRE-family HTH domain
MSSEKITAREKNLPSGQRLKEARKLLKLSQPAFGSRVGWKGSKVKDLEAGYQRIRLEMALAIEEQFQINHRWLLTGEGPMRGPFTRTIALQNVLEGPEGSEPEAQFYKVIAGFSKTVTVVTEEEMAALHQLLTVIRTGDAPTITAIKGNLLMAVRLCKFLNPRFGDIIIIDRRVKQLPQEEWPEGRSLDLRKKASGEE